MMNREHQTPRVQLTFSVLAAALFVWLVGHQWNTHAAQRTLADNFTGGTPSFMNSEEISKVRVRLEAGARSNWHSHGWGQLLLVEQGRGRIQLQDQPVREMRPGEPVFTGSGISHWHGAAPDEPMVMVSMHGGDVEWMGPISDEVYLAEPGR